MKRDTHSAHHLRVDDRPIPYRQGDTIASCLMRAGILATRTSLTGDERGIYCGIGICYECLVTVDGTPNVRACQVDADPEIDVTTLPT
jgi:hypothetical protein